MVCFDFASVNCFQMGPFLWNLDLSVVAVFTKEYHSVKDPN